ncbi:right-handed parallel beta-helix repeat-containing protein [Candidatus Bathyarchaeota archaeon]|nr:right-handed parallel beta-helix repeat-containing protein [Candidatus Bathyarchaeota archaeon]
MISVLCASSRTISGKVLNHRTAASLLLTILLAALLATSFKIVPPVKAAYHIVPDEFPTIQDAIDNADFNVSDTIGVTSGNVYIENINITKPWKIIALGDSDPKKTTIDGYGISNVVTISANDILITGFTIRNSSDWGCGIYIKNASSGNVIFNNIISDNDLGIVLVSPPGENATQYCSRIVLHNNTIVNNTYTGISLLGDNHNITENTLEGNGAGIFGGTYNSWICNNNIVSNPLVYGPAIGLVGSNNTVENNRILNNQGVGIQLSGSFWTQPPNVVKGNVISNNSYGVKLSGTNNSIIMNNNISYSSVCEVFLVDSHNNIVFDNTIRGANRQVDGIRLSSSGNNTIKKNLIDTSFNCVSLNNSDGNIIIENSGATGKYGVSLFSSDSNNITANTLYYNEDSGIYLHLSDENQIHNNTIYRNKDGLLLDYSNWNQIQNNTISRNKNGLLLNYSNRNLISANDVYSNVRLGLILQFSENNTLIDNNLADNKYNFGVWGSSLSHFNHSIDISNMVDGRSIWYLRNQKDRVINSTSVGYLALINCTSITAQCLSLSKNFQGVLLASTSNSELEILNLRDNYYGVYMLWSDNNTLTRSSISNNKQEGYGEGYGIYLYWSVHNTLEENGIESNECAIFLESAVSNNITRNNIQYHEDTVAMELWVSRNNTIYLNNFYTSNIEFTPHFENNWNYSDIGNYWYDDVKGPINETYNIDYHPQQFPFKSALEGDFDYDGDVDIYDIVMIAPAYGSQPGDGNWDIFVDLNENWEIDIYDVVAAANNYGTKWSC